MRVLLSRGVKPARAVRKVVALVSAALLRLTLAAVIAGVSLAVAPARGEAPVNVDLVDIDSGLPSPQGQYRWMDLVDQLYAASYRESYDYASEHSPPASVNVDFFTDAVTFHGTLTASNLKPHFVYQLKLVGNPGTEANERIGLAGRWWEETWDGTKWANGGNLNNKGDGSSPNPNDQVYLSRRDIPDATSPTGRKYRYTAYLVFDYFITDAYGNASFNFTANSSYHVLWKTSQRAATIQDGPPKTATFAVTLPDPVSAYDVAHPEVAASIFGEWERLPVGGVKLPPFAYGANVLLTEESFHGGGLAGGWAAAMGAAVSFTIVPQPGDLDADDDVDAEDLAGFTDCTTGPSLSYGPDSLPANCKLMPDAQGFIAADFDRDMDVDQADFGLLQRSYSEPVILPTHDAGG